MSLESVVTRMVNAGESEANIASVIQTYTSNGRSPLKHLEEGHELLTQKEHDKKHKKTGDKYNYKNVKINIGTEEEPLLQDIWEAKEMGEDGTERVVVVEEFNEEGNPNIPREHIELKQNTLRKQPLSQMSVPDAIDSVKENIYEEREKRDELEIDIQKKYNLLLDYNANESIPEKPDWVIPPSNITDIEGNPIEPTEQEIQNYNNDLLNKWKEDVKQYRNNQNNFYGSDFFKSYKSAEDVLEQKKELGLLRDKKGNKVDSYTDADILKEVEDEYYVEWQTKYIKDQLTKRFEANLDWKDTAWSIFDVGLDKLSGGILDIDTEDLPEDQQIFLKNLQEHYKKYGTKRDITTDAPILSEPIRKKHEELSLLNNFINLNVEDLSEKEQNVNEYNTTWKNKFTPLTERLENLKSIPDVIEQLNNFQVQLNTFSDVAIDGKLEEEDYAKYQAINNKYTSLLNENQDDINSYSKTVEEYNTAHEEYNKPYKDLTGKVWENQGEYLTSIYTTSLNDLKAKNIVHNELYEALMNFMEDDKDLALYTNMAKRDYRNIVQWDTYMKTSLVNLASGAESAVHAVLPATLIENGLKEYYGDKDPFTGEYSEDVPDIVKSFFAIKDWQNQPREKVKAAINELTANWMSGVQERTNWHDIDDSYDWGEYVLGASADFAPQLGMMIAMPQAALYVLAASSGGNKYDQMVKENKFGAGYSMFDIYFASGITGLGEYWTEKVTLGLIKKTGIGLQGIKREGFKKGMQKLVSPKNIGYGVLDIGVESLSEVGAKMTENFGDIVAGKNISIFEGADEAGFNGLVMSGHIKAPLLFKRMVVPFLPKEDAVIVNENTIEMMSIDKQMAEVEEGSDAMKALEERLNDILAQNNSILSRTVDRVNGMTAEEKRAVMDADILRYETENKIQEILKSDASLETRKQEIEKVKNEFYKANKTASEAIREAQIRMDTEAAKKALVKAGVVEEGNYKSIEDVEDFQRQYEELSGKTDNRKNSDAVIIKQADGTTFVLLNTTRQKQVNSVSAASHDTFHGIINATINGPSRTIKNPQGEEVEVDITKEGFELMKSFLNSLSKSERALVQKRIDDNYRYKKDPLYNPKDPKTKRFLLDEDGNKIENAEEEYAEEYMTSYSDILRKELVKPSGVSLFNIAGLYQKYFEGKGYENLEFKSGQDIKTLIQDYTKDIKSGEVRQEILDIAKPGAATIGTVKASETVSGFEDSDIVSDLGLKKNTAKIVARNKGIEETIIKEGIKDEKGNIQASPAQQRKLAENNLPRAFALARQAAGKANDLTLEEALKMNDVMEWYSEYSLKLTELARTYRAVKNGKQVPFGAYMNSLLPKKYSGILDKLKSKIETTRIDDPAIAKKIGRMSTPTTTLSNMEVEGKKIALNTIDQNKVQKKIIDVVKRNPTLSKLRKYKEVKSELVAHNNPKKKSNRKPTGKLYEALEAVSEIFGVDAMRIIQEQDLDTAMRKSAQDVILAKTNEIIAMMPFGTTASGDATGIANTKLGIFFKKLARTTMKATGTGKGLNVQQKQNIDPKRFRELVGLVKGGRINNTSVDGAIRAIIVQVASIASNQAVRQVYGPETLPLKDGKASTMFSETYQAPFLQEMGELSRAMKLEQGTWNSIAKRFGFEPIDMKTDWGRYEFENWMFENLNQYLPLVFFQHSGNWTGTTEHWTDIQTGEEIRLHGRNLAYKNVSELHAAIEAAMQDGRVWQGEAMSEKDKQDIANALFRVKLTDSSLTDAKFKASKERGFKLIWKQFDKMMEDNPNNARGILALLSSSSSQQNHFMRTGSTNEFTNLEDGVTREEHQQPATDLAKFLFNRLAEKNLFKGDTFKNAVAGYQQGKLLKVDDDKLNTPTTNYQSNAGEFMYPIFAGIMPIWVRYFNPNVNANNGGINPNAYKLANGNTIAQEYGIDVAPKLTTPSVIAKQQDLLFQIFTGLITQASATRAINSLANVKIKQNIKKSKTLNNARVKASESIKEPKGITVLDFDDTLATTKSLVKFTAPDGTKGALNAEQYANTYQDLLAQGYRFDFTEFDKVVKAKLAPLFNKALKLQKKFGPENMFILTARPPAAQKAIYDFLKANGLNIPLKNITGLGNSTAEAKALWIAEKVGEGYNDFYFADDALQNTQAVQNMLDQFDVKSKVQQAKVKFSETMNENFNDILENITGIESNKRFSAIKARKRGANKGKFRFFIPPSHEDFVGLLYNFMGKGKVGNTHRDFWETTLVRPLNRAYRELNTAKQAIANDYKSLNKEFKNVRKKLTKKTPDGDFTYQDAIRVYLWNKHGHKVPGLNKTDQQKLVDLVIKDSELQTYAETLNIISKQDTYVNATESWEAGDIRTDLDDATGRVGRKQFFTEFNENIEIIFSEENFNKIEAAYGADVVSAIKDILYRTKTGRNRPSGQNELTNRFMNYLNGSVAATMFFNIRSAVLQQMSMVNFINFADNNILAAAKAFANQKQYWKDWAFIFNSDFMKQRRGGIKTDINGAELAASLRGAKNTPRALLAKLLEFGFKPTQIGDNNAIATGGATFYRNRINTYLKQGLSQKEAESKAWIDFQVIAEATQQSARPDMVSQQQASPLGKIILAFQNVTSQFNRLGKKAFLDIKNRRISPEYKNTSNPQLQSDMSNASRIAYYFAIQNLIFYSLQTALFSAMFDDDEDDERMLKKKERVINGTIDSILRGSGVWGAVISTLKNMAIKSHEQRGKDWNGDEASVLVEMLNVSPPLGIKARKMVNAERTLNYNKSVMEEMKTFDIDNPMWSAYTSRIEAITNIPLNRLYNKTQNVRQSLDNQHTATQRVLMFSGWSQWNLGIENEKLEKIKESIKVKKRVIAKEKTKIKREEKKKIEDKKKIEEGKKKQEQEKKENKQVTCLKCKLPTVEGKKYCTVHEKKEQNETGKKTQCKFMKQVTKKRKTRCGMQTSNKSGYCYYHD